MKEKLRKEELRGHHQQCWLKAEAHKNKKKYSRKDRRKNKNHGYTEYTEPTDNL